MSALQEALGENLPKNTWAKKVRLVANPIIEPQDIASCFLSWLAFCGVAGPLRDVGATGRMSANVELAVPPTGTRASVRGRFVLRSHQKCVPQHQAPEIAHSSGLGLDAEARQVECICVCNFLLQRFRSPVLKYLVLNGFPWVKFFWRVFFELWSSVVPPLILCPYGQCIFPESLCSF